MAARWALDPDGQGSNPWRGAQQREREQPLSRSGANLREWLARNGVWRSLVAHLTGGQGVAGSNPVIPTWVHSGLGGSQKDVLMLQT